MNKKKPTRKARMSVECAAYIECPHCDLELYLDVAELTVNGELDDFDRCKITCTECQGAIEINSINPLSRGSSSTGWEVQE